MIVNDTVIAGVKTANQLDTYPVGTELILNNGPMANQGDAGAAEPKPGVSPLTYTVPYGGTKQIGISNPNSEAVTCTVKTGTEYCSVTNAGLITNRNSGGTDASATIDVTASPLGFEIPICFVPPLGTVYVRGLTPGLASAAPASP